MIRRCQQQAVFQAMHHRIRGSRLKRSECPDGRSLHSNVTEKGKGPGPEKVRRDRFTELDRVSLYQSAAPGAVRRKVPGIDLDLVRIEARDTIQAAKQAVIAVDLRQRARSGSMK